MPRFWSRVGLILTLHCEQASQLMSASLDDELAWHELWALRMHWVSCRPCKRLRDQLRFLRQAGRRWLHLQDGEPESVELSAAARERIRRVLNQAANQASDE